MKRKPGGTARWYEAQVERWTGKLGIHPGMYLLVLFTALYFAARIGGQVVGPAMSGACHDIQSWLVTER
jgi:hypothetical protein